MSRKHLCRSQESLIEACFHVNFEEISKTSILNCFRFKHPFSVNAYLRGMKRNIKTYLHRYVSHKIYSQKNNGEGCRLKYSCIYVGLGF